MTISFSGLSLPDPVTVDINVRVSGQIAIGSLAARQRVNRFVVSQIGNLFCAGEPELVVGDRFRWRVPVLLTMPGRGVLGEVGEIVLDAQTGELDAQEQTITTIHRNARSLVGGSSSSPEQ